MDIGSPDKKAEPAKEGAPPSRERAFLGHHPVDGSSGRPWTTAHNRHILWRSARATPWAHPTHGPESSGPPSSGRPGRRDCLRMAPNRRCAARARPTGVAATAESEAMHRAFAPSGDRVRAARPGTWGLGGSGEEERRGDPHTTWLSISAPGQFSVRPPRVAQIWPKADQCWSTSGHIWSVAGPMRWSISVKLGLSLAHVRPNSYVAELGRSLAKLGRLRATFG